MRNPLNYLVAIFAVLASLPGIASAQEDQSVQPASFLDTNTIGYLHVDLQEFDFVKAFELLIENEDVLGLSQPSVSKKLTVARSMVLGTVEILRDKGAKDAYVFLNLSDLGALSVVVPASDETQAKSFKLAFPPGELIGNNLVIGPQGGARNILAFELPKRTDADALLEISEGHQATLVIAPSKDHARVFGEVMPDLPEPLDDVDGELVADGFVRCVVTIDSLDPVSGQVTIDSRSEKASQAIFTKSSQLLLAMANGDFGLTLGQLEILQPALKTFKPKQSGKVIEIGFVESDFEILKPAMGGLIEEATFRNGKQQILNSLRELSLTMFNFESKNKRLPGYANFDNDGNALLSWRVHVLPFMQQEELYQQFHLNEPWDSPHNIKLVDKMPEIFRAPFGWTDKETHTKLVTEGKTVFVMPIGEGMYGTKDGLRIVDVTDGTSNTIMLFAVRAELAVPWTKPVGVEIDLSDPVPTLLDQTGTGVATAFGDSFAQFLPADIDAKTMRLLLQVGDGEIIDRDW